MLARIESACLHGLEALPVKIEVDICQGLPSFQIVGLPDTALQESRERVRAGITNAGFDFPMRRITINLAPADVRKEGPALDLPIALGILAATGQIDEKTLGPYYSYGELSLTGEIRPVLGTLAVAMKARDEGKLGLVLPQANVWEGALISGLKVFGAADLQEIVAWLGNGQKATPSGGPSGPAAAAQERVHLDYGDVKGQEHVKRAIEVAAAGAHNVLMIGPPGTGKTMMSRRLPSVLPELSEEESIEVTRIYSIAGKLPQGGGLMRFRPFRSPHHTCSDVALVGGGRCPRPGEVSLSHRGVLFLDELPEFSKSALEVLRQPLEDGRVTVSRALTSFTFPAVFTLIASMNPCRCGYHGDPSGACSCSTATIRNYRSKISGPLLDRIDIHVEAPRLGRHELVSAPGGTTSSEMRERVAQARRRQRYRFKGLGIECNGHMEPRHVRRFCTLAREGRALLESLVDGYSFSARAYDRILKVARTIADLEGAADIDAQHLGEAAQYRSMDTDQPL